MNGNKGPPGNGKKSWLVMEETTTQLFRGKGRRIGELAPCWTAIMGIPVQGRS